MILREICTEPLSEWEECFVAASYLKRLELSGAALEEERRERVGSCLKLLHTMPNDMARELCIEVLRHAEDKDIKFK